SAHPKTALDIAPFTASARTGYPPVAAASDPSPPPAFPVRPTGPCRNPTVLRDYYLYGVYNQDEEATHENTAFRNRHRRHTAKGLGHHARQGDLHQMGQRLMARVDLPGRVDAGRADPVQRRG